MRSSRRWWLGSITALVLLIWGWLIMAAGAQTPTVRIHGAWLAPDNQLSLQVTVPEAIQSASVTSGANTQSLTIQASPPETQTWILLDASETMLNRQIVVQTVLQSFLADNTTPLTLLTYQRTIQPATDANLDNLAVLAQYSATAGTPGCLGDALQRISTLYHPPTALWRVLVITGGWTTQTDCENTTLPTMAIPVDVLLVGTPPAPELVALAQDTNGTFLTSDVRQIATHLTEISTLWAQQTVVLTGDLANLAPDNLQLKLTLADGTTTQLPLSLRLLPTPTPTLTLTPTITSTSTLTLTPSYTPTATYTPTPTLTATPSATATPTATPTNTLTATHTATATATFTDTATNTPTAIPTATYTETVIPSSTPTATFTVTDTPTATQTEISLVMPPASFATTAPVVGANPDNPSANPNFDTDGALIVLAIVAALGWLTAIALYFRIPRIITVPSAATAIPDAQTFYDSLGPRNQFAAPLSPVRPSAPTAMPNLATRQRPRTDFTAQRDALLTPLSSDNPVAKPNDDRWLQTGTQLVSDRDLEQMISNDIAAPTTDSSLVVGWLRLLSLDPPIDYAIYQHKLIMMMGQAIDNHIVLPEDEAVAPYHARLDITALGAVTITSINPDQSILINRQPMTGAYTLRPADEIELSPRLRFVYIVADVDRDTDPPRP